MPLPNWMVYTLYGNAMLDLTIFISPGSLAVSDLIDAKFKSPEGELKEMKEHFCAVGGFSFLLHGAVRFCAGYFKSKEMVCLAIFSYFLEVAQIGHFWGKGTANKATAAVAALVIAWSSSLAYVCFA
mmetsp:Transcript_69739/g.110192  ORF Transcript_69739/g.110192 Transcript_69739/m.110192 type:complete len:127 (-) Transcript_69739:7-387(-)